jgi:hypothetical protein
MIRYTLLALLLVGCCARDLCGGKLITECDFHCIGTGAPVTELVECLGTPYAVCDGCCEGQKEYLYIQRVHIARDVTEHIHYKFYVVEGVVVDKCMEHHGAPVDFTFE